jgi:hypothetical protein
VKHEGGASAVEMAAQLASDLASWSLNDMHFTALVTDTAVNMNLLGFMLEEKYPKTAHLYCVDHNLQLTAVKAFSGDVKERFSTMILRDGDNEKYF